MRFYRLQKYAFFSRVESFEYLCIAKCETHPLELVIIQPIK